jgi:hypothetical protein
MRGHWTGLNAANLSRAVRGYGFRISAFLRHVVPCAPSATDVRAEMRSDAHAEDGIVDALRGAFRARHGHRSGNRRMAEPAPSAALLLKSLMFFVCLDPLASLTG